MKIRTFTGRLVSPLTITPDDIDIRDIAVSLSRQCRFGGHLAEHYSVAQHSVLVATYINPAAELEGLLHDASEAYLNDLTTPVKHLPELAGYCDLERRVMHAIGERFGLGLLHWADEIKRVDRRALATELRDVCPGGTDTLTVGGQPVFPLFDAPLALRAQPAEEACRMFLGRFAALVEKR